MTYPAGMTRQRRGVLATLLALGLAAALSSGVVHATPPQPSYGTAVVDGDYSEWNLVRDQFSAMYEAGDTGKTEFAYAYLRYSCSTQTLYVLVLRLHSFALLTTPGESWGSIDGSGSKIFSDSSGNNGVPPDFQFVAPGFDGDSNHAQGYEASFNISPGSHTIQLHADIDLNGAQTARLPDFTSLQINCSTSVTVGDFEATRGVSGVRLSWATGSEVGLAGFNIWRSNRSDAGYEQINPALIPVVNPSGLAGATYTFVDRSSTNGGPYYYRLEIIGSDRSSRVIGPSIVSQAGDAPRGDGGR